MAARDEFTADELDELFELRNTPAAHYILMNDIDLTEFIQDENPTMGWTPIPDFSGELDGNGMTLSGLFINRSSQSGVGLFSSLSGSTATVHDLIIDAPRITGGNYTAVIAGQGTGIFYNITVNEPVMTGASYSGIVTGDGGGNIHDATITSPRVSSASNRIGIITGEVSKENTEIYNITITNAQVAGGTYVGGIVGGMGNVTETSGSFYVTSRTISKNHYCGTIQSASSYAGASWAMSAIT
ncbi:MAG: hypothetical protein IJT30_02260 [Muribaculaceae bacterium]|nr:hypothetical protein [Muribaculaceae bacterium]